MRDSYRILARGQRVCNDTRVSGLNNNDIIIGPSGSGKTRGYVRPNLLACQDESVIITDTKGTLLPEVGGQMARRGYEVQSIDFTQLGGSHGYDPLDFVRRGSRPGDYDQQDVLTIAKAICPVECSKDPYWEETAAILLTVLIGYVLESKPRSCQNMAAVVDIFERMDRKESGDTVSFLAREISRLAEQNPNSLAVRSYLQLLGLKEAEKTYACVVNFLAQKLHLFSINGVSHLSRKQKRVNFPCIGRKKTALFLTVSDTDRSMDRLIKLFYTQAFQSLCRTADRRCADHRLKVPVRFILDDFACGAVIQDFDNIISVIRSRDISVSLIIQSLSQLEGLYGHARAMTIINNCDHCLYLGGQDVETAQYFSIKMNRTVDTILSLPLNAAILFARGQRPREVEKFDLRDLEAVPKEGKKPDLPRRGQGARLLAAEPEDAEEAIPLKGRRPPVYKAG